ncbi:MAG TPA: NAD(P)-dependent oxidoreductase [Ktedonobacterales bacterium]|nr:NAD(P)-dependent oxidoreductase [Ktedonobacterales bacterium]
MAPFLCELGADPVCGDLWNDELLRESVQRSDAVLHLATKIPSPATMSKRAAWRETSRIRAEGTRRIVTYALDSRVRTLIYPGLGFIYPDSGDRWIDATNSEPLATDFYRTTFDAEREMRRITTTGGRAVILRRGFFYGPTSSQSVAQVQCARWGIATVPGATNIYHPFLAIDDAARAVVTALERAPDGTFDIVGDNPPTTQAIDQAMAAAVGRKQLRSLPDFLVRRTFGREGYAVFARSQRVSNQRFKEATGWQPQVALADGWQAIANAMGGAR